MTQKSLSRYLKYAILIVGLCGLMVYALALPLGGRAIFLAHPDGKNGFWPWMVYLWLSALPCYAVLLKGWAIARDIGCDRSFTSENARRLKVISYLAAGDAAYVFIGGLIMLALGLSHPLVFAALAMVALCGLAIAVAAACVSHLVLKAADLQYESDLTV